MTLIKPFRALRPAPGRAAEVLAPPYDVLSSAEARERVKGKAWSFLHVSKAEIDLDPATDPYDGAVYAKAAANLKAMIAAGVLDPRRQAELLRLPDDLARPRFDRACGGRLARRLRQQPRPPPRAHHAGQGRRPGAPDRSGQRADRPGHARLPDGAADRRHARARCVRRSRIRRHRRRRRAAPALGDQRRRNRRGADRGGRCLAGALYRRRPSPLGRRRARRQIPRRRRAGLFPHRDVSAERDDDPRL